MRRVKSFIMETVAIIIRSAQHGGVENHVHDLIKNIKDSNFRPILISLVDEPVSHKFIDLNIDIVYARDQLNMSYFSFINIYYLYKLLKRISPDVVHCHGTRPIFIGSVAAFLAGVRRRILTVHNSYKLMAHNGSNHIDIKKLFASKIMHCIGFFLAKRIIFVSEVLLNEFVAGFNNFPFIEKTVNKKSIVIYNSVDRKIFFKSKDSGKLKLKLGIECANKIIGYVGRLDPNKNVELLIASVKKLTDTKVDCDLIIVGDGYYRHELEAYARSLGIEGRIHFYGQQKNLTEFYNIMDVFVLPSNSEGFALVIIEAMACHVPVISTNVGIAEVVIQENKNGIIIDKNNMPELINALSKVLTDTIFRNKIAKNGADIIEYLFDQKTSTIKIISQYS